MSCIDDDWFQYDSIKSETWQLHLSVSEYFFFALFVGVGTRSYLEVSYYQSCAFPLKKKKLTIPSGVNNEKKACRMGYLLLLEKSSPW